MKREKIFDVLRVISIFLVIVIHISNFYMRRYNLISFDNYLIAGIFNTISRVSVPIFFMISGSLILDKDYDFIKYKDRLIKFIKILIFWSLIYILWDKFYMNKDINIINSIISIIFTPSKAHLWFMYAIIGVYFVIPFVRILVKNMNEKEENLFIKLYIFFTGFIYIFRLIISIFNIKTTVLYPVPIFQATYYLGYFIIGYIIYKRLSLNDYKKYNIKLLLVYIISTLITFVSTILLSIHNSSYFENLFAYRSLFMMLSSISIFMLFIINKEKILSKLNENIILNLSKYSFGIYLIHVIVFNFITENINIINYSSLLFIPLISLVIYIISYILVIIFNKIKILSQFF